MPGVEPVEARPPVRRRRHAEVHLGRAGLAQHADDLARRGAAHDRVVDDDDALALDVLAQRIELDAHAAAALLLARLDERAADVTVLHEPVAVRDARLARVALRGGHSGLGHRHHHVGNARRLARELLAHALARGVHALAVELRVGARDVDELEDAELRLGLRRSASSARRSRRSRPSRPARRRARSARRRCRAPRFRSRGPSRPRSDRARAGGSRCGRARRTGALRPSARARTRRRDAAAPAAARSRGRDRRSDRARCTRGRAAHRSARCRTSARPAASRARPRAPRCS